LVADAPHRSFTPEEANASLDEVRPLVERLVAAKRTLDEAQERHDGLARSISGNGGGIRPDDLAELRGELGRRAEALAGIVEEIRAIGVLVKDLDAGLVDFPSIRDGEEVLLCWRLGEDRVAFWHGLEDGFAGRRPI
jgi:hypothetical protein